MIARYYNQINWYYYLRQRGEGLAGFSFVGLILAFPLLEIEDVLVLLVVFSAVFFGLGFLLYRLLFKAVLLRVECEDAILSELMSNRPPTLIGGRPLVLFLRGRSHIEKINHSMEKVLDLEQRNFYWRNFPVIGLFVEWLSKSQRAARRERESLRDPELLLFATLSQTSDIIAVGSDNAGDYVVKVEPDDSVWQKVVKKLAEESAAIFWVTDSAPALVWELGQLSADPRTREKLFVMALPDATEACWKQAAEMSSLSIDLLWTYKGQGFISSIPAQARPNAVMPLDDFFYSAQRQFGKKKVEITGPKVLHLIQSYRS